MEILKHGFTDKIIEILESCFLTENGSRLLESSSLLQYLNIKTKAANRGSKSRAGFGNIYAIYVLVEDYLNNEFHTKPDEYEYYEGAKFSMLLQRQRELPFGSKLQNHALNHRLNQEFKKYFPTSLYQPIIRDSQTNRYWINENLLRIQIQDEVFNLAEAIKDLIGAYIEERCKAFNEFMEYCRRMIDIQKQNPDEAVEFIRGLLKPQIDARVFEIVSYSILKEFYSEQLIYWGWSPQELNSEYLILYKTGRTNANDGGIDFVMKPLGRFFQVTETISADKYFLDIDKVQRYPITFVVKTEQSVEEILKSIEEQATKKYKVKAIVRRYIESIEEVINIPDLMLRFDRIISQNRGSEVIQEIVIQSRVEFNVELEEQDLFIDNNLNPEAESR